MSIGKKSTNALLASCLGLALPFIAHGQTLPQAVSYTLKTNPDVLIRVHDRYAADQALNQAKAGWLPSVNLTAGYGREKTNSPLITGTPTLSRRESNLSLTENLFSGFATTFEIDRTEAQVDSAAYEVDGAAQDAALEVSEAYFNVLRDRDNVALARRNLKAHQKLYNQISQRAQGGLSHKADQDQARSRLALARSNLASQRSLYRDAVSSFIQVTGTRPTSLSMPAMLKPSYFPKTERQAVEDALAGHPVLASAYAKAREALAQHDASKSAFYPNLDFVLSASRNDNIDGVRGINNDDAAMLQLQWNLFNGGADVARMRETAQLAESTQQAYNRTRRQVAESMRLSWNAYQTSLARLSSLRTHYFSSRKTVSAYREQFDIGKRSLFDLLDAENEAFRAGLDYTQGRYDLRFARYRVLADMGKLVRAMKVNLPAAAQPLLASNHFTKYQRNRDHAFISSTLLTKPGEKYNYHSHSHHFVFSSHDDNVGHTHDVNSKKVAATKASTGTTPIKNS